MGGRRNRVNPGQVASYGIQREDVLQTLFFVGVYQTSKEAPQGNCAEEISSGIQNVLSVFWLSLLMCLFSVTLRSGSWRKHQLDRAADKEIPGDAPPILRFDNGLLSS